MIEHIKTTILWVLILLSVFLTYQIWTFQPNYGILKNTEYIDNTQIGVEKHLSEVIHPKQIIINNAGDFFSPIESSSNTKKYYEQYVGVTIEDLTLSSSPVDLRNEKNVKAMEYIFSTKIPFEALKEIYQFTNSEQTLIQNIDQIIFYLYEKDDIEQIKVRFISFDDQIIAEAVTNVSVSKFKEDLMMEVKEDFMEVFPYELVNSDNVFSKIVFLPEENVSVNSVTYLANSIDAEHFKELLFSDPNFVKHYSQSNGEESFTDGNRMMNVLYSGNVLRYINPYFGEAVERSNKTSLLMSLDFLNGHGGFTNTFYYDSLKSIGVSDEVTFRLFIDGLPVYKSNFYSGNNLFEITLNRGNGNQIEQYVRPLFKLEENEPINITQSAILPSGHELLKEISSLEDFDPQLLTDINKGFSMIKRQSFVILEPKWFIRYKGNWQEVDFVSESGDSEAIINGLE